MNAVDHLASFDPRVCLYGKISRIHRLTANIFRKYMAPFGVTTSQVSLLFILSKNDALTQKQLSDIVRLEKSSLHRNLKRLVDRELLDKKIFPQISITEKGNALVLRLIPEWEEAMVEIRSVIGQEGESSINLIHQRLTAKA